MVSKGLEHEQSARRRKYSVCVVSSSSRQQVQTSIVTWRTYITTWDDGYIPNFSIKAKQFNHNKIVYVLIHTTRICKDTFLGHHVLQSKVAWACHLIQVKKIRAANAF